MRSLHGACRTPQTILSYADLYGWTMDTIVERIGLKSNCTYCGVFRRQALDRGAKHEGADVIATGHNADDVAETVIMNVLRGDVARLTRTTQASTSHEGGFMPRVKPFLYTYEKEIVLYAYFQRLDYVATECLYSPQAYRGWAREYIKDVETARPTAILDIIHAAQQLAPPEAKHLPTLGSCTRCGYMSSQPLCKACQLLDGLAATEPSTRVETACESSGTT